MSLWFQGLVWVDRGNRVHVEGHTMSVRDRCVRRGTHRSVHFRVPCVRRWAHKEMASDDLLRDHLTNINSTTTSGTGDLW